MKVRKISTRYYIPELNQMTDSTLEVALLHCLPTFKDIIELSSLGINDRNGVEIFEGDLWRDDEGRLFIAQYINEWSRYAWLNEEEHFKYNIKGISELDESMQEGFGIFSDESKYYNVVGNCFQHYQPSKYNIKSGDFLVFKEHLGYSARQAYGVMEVWEGCVTVASGTDGCMSKNYNQFRFANETDIKNRVLNIATYFDNNTKK